MDTCAAITGFQETSYWAQHHAKWGQLMKFVQAGVSPLSLSPTILPACLPYKIDIVENRCEVLWEDIKCDSMASKATVFCIAQ